MNPSRDLIHVLKSFVNLGDFSERYDGWRHWMHRQRSRNSRSRMDPETVIVTKPSVPNRGFFSLIIQAVANSYDLRNEYDRFYFDYRGSDFFRDERLGEDNFFNNYFVQDKNLLASPRQREVDWVSVWHVRRDTWQSIGGETRAEIGRVVRRRLRIKDTILSKIDRIERERFGGRRILGLHKRGTDHGFHGELLPLTDYFSAVDRHIGAFDRLYLATDEADTVRRFQERYRDKLIYLDDVFRSSDERSVHEHTFENNYKKGEDVLIEAVLLSRVDFLLKTMSNVSLFSILHNPDLPYERLDPHVEYHT